MGIALALPTVMKGVWRFQDLVAWQLAVRLQGVADGSCLKPAIRRDFKFHDQLSDAAASAPRNIAEGFGRVYHPEFARFAIIAKASEQEGLNHFIAAHKRGLLTDQELDEGDHTVRRALKVLNGLIAYLGSNSRLGQGLTAPVAPVAPVFTDQSRTDIYNRA